MGRLARASTHELHGLPLSFLMAADRYHHQEHVIVPALEAGRVVVCDRYVTTAMVLDQLDGADPEFIWGIYRYLRWPDVAVILTGDPAVCRARAAGRGVYSRFHEGGADAGKSEAALYDRSAGLLAGYGYPIAILAIGDRTAEQVAGDMIGLIQDRMITRNTGEGEPWMRVALLYPEVYDMARFKDKRKEFPPFGVLYLAAVIEQAGHGVTVEAVTPSHTRLELGGFDAVGFSLASSATYGLMLQARRESMFAEHALIMVGGVHCNFFPESSLTDFDADLAADGESEETILEILERGAQRDFAGIPGILWRGQGGKVHRNPARPLMRDISQLPLPARHLLSAENVVLADRLAGTDLRMAHVMFSRGCPFPCSFCAAGQTRIQYRSW